MKVCFFSDIHGNLDALQAVLQATEGCTEIYFCGDAVGYGDQPDEVCSLLRQRKIPSILGNHDCYVLGRLPYDQRNEQRYRTRWTADRLSKDNLKWLDSLPDEIRLSVNGHAIWLRHASPWDLTTYLYPDAAELMRAAPTDGSTLVVGHSHHQFVRPGNNGCIVNCGSAGLPRSGAAGAQYAEFDADTGSWTFRCAAYDIKALQERLREGGWDPSVVARLANPNARRG